MTRWRGEKRLLPVNERVVRFVSDGHSPLHSCTTTIRTGSSQIRTDPRDVLLECRENAR